MTSRAYVGQPVRRKEDLRLLTGQGRFAADVGLPGLLHAAAFRSDRAHARIVAIDAGRARRVPGVVAVFTGEALGSVGRIPTTIVQRPNLRACFQPVIAADQVRYVGEPLAVVVATDRYVAEDALELIEARLEPLPVVNDGTAALAPGAPVLHPALGTNLVERIEMRRGDPDAVLRDSPHRLRTSFGIQRHSASPLETRSITAAYDPGLRTLTVWGPTKMVHHTRAILADLLDHPQHLIRFIETDIGGGFGVRGEFFPEDFLIPWAAVRLGRPIRWVEDRREHFLASNHCREQWHDVEIGVTRQGEILVLVDRALVDLGAYVRPNAFVAPERTPAFLPGPYRIPTFALEISCVLTNKTPAGSYRGPGRVEGTFVRERLVDLVCRELGLDPADVRRRNLIEPEAMPYEVGTTTHGQPVVYDGGDYGATFDAAVAALDYKGARRAQAAARRNGRYVGIGFAAIVDSSGAPPWESARVMIDGSGSVVVYSGAANLGQGLETTLAQICAHELGIDIDTVSVVHGDTALIPFGIGSYGSRGGAVGGSAVLEASRRLKAKILRLAADVLEASAGDLVLAGGRVSVRGVPDRGLALRDLARAAQPERMAALGMEPGLEATHYFHVRGLPYSHATNAALVDVDIETGRVRVLKYVLVCEVGKAINPMIVGGQLIGGLAQGIGAALLEALTYDEHGQLLTTTFMDYLLPAAVDMPDETIMRITEDAPSPHNPLGVKGAGEMGIIGAPAAIANAVEDALAPFGVRITAPPMSPDLLRRLVDESQAAMRGDSQER